MARKTWVKVKRGFLTDPKHRLALGNRIWLYLYMLDVTDWDTGKILEWRDRAASDDLQMPMSTVRTQRREIEEAGYISCKQLHRRQVITIKRWINPREYSGQIYNDDQGDQEYTPSETEEKADGDNDGDNNGYNHGVNDGIQNLTPLHINHISHITDHKREGAGDLFQQCRKIYETKKGRLVTDGASFSLMVKNFEKQGATAEDYAAAIDAMDADPRYKGTNPTSYEKWTLGIADKRQNPARANKKQPKEEFDLDKFVKEVFDD